MIDNLFNEMIREQATLTINEDDIDKLLTITKETIKNIKDVNVGGNYFV